MSLIEIVRWRKLAYFELVLLVYTACCGAVNNLSSIRYFVVDV